MNSAHRHPKQTPPTRWVTALVWTVVGAWALWALMRVSGREPAFPGGVAMALTPYVAAGSFAPFMVALLARRWRAVLVATVTMLLFAAAVTPRALSGSPAPAPEQSLRILTINSYAGNVSVPQLTELVRQKNVDVIAVQEASWRLVRTLRKAGLQDDLPYLAYSATGSDLYFIGSGNLPAAVDPDTSEPAPSTPSAVYSRYPLHPAPRDFSHSGERAMPAAVLALPGTDVAIKVVHITRPTHPATWDRELRTLPGTTPHGAPRILAGDFNATLDHSALRAVLDKGYRDAAASVGEGLTPTWPRRRSHPSGWFTIDHILTDPRLTVTNVSVHPLNGTDHLAVLAYLRLPT
jgi:endonuclease/exonuclease/phosphatase family metal-dependent hydrolase